MTLSVLLQTLIKCFDSEDCILTMEDVANLLMHVCDIHKIHVKVSIISRYTFMLLVY